MKTQSFFDLTVRAPVRLARMRKAFAEKSTKYPHMNYKTWRDIRGTNFKSINAYCAELSQGLNDKKPIWYCHTGEQFRHEKTASDWAGSRWTFAGYYTDTDCHDTAHGIVARLTHGRFIAGYVWSSNGERVYFPKVFTDEDTACCFADSEAESFAELCMIESEKFDTAQKLQIDIDDALSRLRECLALRHRACMAYVRDEISELCETIRDSRATLKNDYAQYL